MQESNFYASRASSIGFGLVSGIFSLFLFAIAYMFISGTIGNMNSVKKFFIGILFFMLFLAPPIMFLIVSIHHFKRKTIVCTLTHRELIISKYNSRWGATTDLRYNLNSIKQVTIVKGILPKDRGIKIDLKNQKKVDLLHANINLSNDDKLRLKKEIEDRLSITFG